MKKTTLLMKGRWRTALLVLLLWLVGMGKGYASDWYDFSALCSTGQRLYYQIIDATNHHVALVPPNGCEGWDGYTEPTGNIVLPESVSYQGTSYTVTSIAFDAFYKCDGLTGSLNIPNTVTSIGSEAFYRCSQITEITISNSVMSIESNAFCESGWYESQPYGIMYLDGWCLGYKRLKPTGDLVIREGTKGIANRGFSGCGQLTSIHFPNTLMAIGSYSFSYCEGLSGSLIIPDSVKEIGR